VLDRVAQIVENITTFPERGSRPQELRPGMRTDCRQVFFKPYRAIYQVRPTEVVIVLIADGRRNLQSLLLRRLRKD
jgi:toxin ParE1/3/4